MDLDAHVAAAAAAFFGALMLPEIVNLTSQERGKNLDSSYRLFCARAVGPDKDENGAGCVQGTFHVPAWVRMPNIKSATSSSAGKEACTH
eukprot:419654-Pelagomonas_calceolata.AAC.4